MFEVFGILQDTLLGRIALVEVLVKVFQNNVSQRPGWILPGSLDQHRQLFEWSPKLKALHIVQSRKNSLPLVVSETKSSAVVYNETFGIIVAVLE
jgi:hypothetical protein